MTSSLPENELNLELKCEPLGDGDSKDNFDADKKDDTFDVSDPDSKSNEKVNVVLLDIEDSISSKVPLRIKAGRFFPDYIEVELSEKTEKINYNDIEYICAGLIMDKSLTSSPPKTALGQMLQSIFAGDRDTEKPQPVITVNYILDIYVKDKFLPFRINAAFVNYKSFLDKVGYISFDNFKLLLKKIASQSSNSVLNDTSYRLLLNKQAQKKYSSEVEFLIESSEKRKDLTAEFTWASVFACDKEE